VTGVEPATLCLATITLARMDAVAARLRMTRSRLVREALDALLMRFECEGAERPAAVAK